MDEQIFLVQEGTAERLLEIKVKAVLENVPRVTRIVAQAAAHLGFEESALYQIELAVDEACANVVEHAYPHSEQGDMEIVCFRHERHLVIRVRDWGSGFDPGAVDEPDVLAPLEDRGLGGLGLFLVRRVMDGVRFRFDPEAGNELFMVKRLDVAA